MSTYDDASLIMYPSGYKADKIYSLKPTDGSGDLTFTRASTATRVNESGLIESVASGVPRIDYTGGGCGKFLFEPQRTNSFTFSENITNFSFLGRSNCGYTLGGSFGSFSTSCLVTSTSFSASKINAVLGFNSVNTENNYFTIRFQKKSGWYLYILAGNGCDSGSLKINLASGGGYISSSGTMLTDYKVVEFTDYFEIGFKTTQNATTGAGLINLRLYDNASFTNYNDAGGTTFNVSGIQWENLATYPTSYIPTAGATTRLADTSVTTGLGALIGQSEGTIILDLVYSDLDNTHFCLSDGTNNNRIQIAKPAGGSFLNFVVQLGGVVQANVNTSQTVAINTRYKILLSYDENDFRIYVNGVKVGEDLSGSTFVNELTNVTFGDPDNDQSLYGNINSLILKQTATINSEAIELTTI